MKVKPTPTQVVFVPSVIEKPQQKKQVIQAVQQVLAQAAESAQQRVIPSSPTRRQILAKITTSPPRSSPRTETAQRLSRIGLGNDPVSTSRKLADLFQAPMPLPVVSPQKMRLAGLLDAYQVRFWEFLKTNSTKPLVQGSDVMTLRPLLALREVLLGVESQEFLDQYITRDSAVGKNKEPQVREKLQKFHEKLIALKEALEGVGILSVQEGETINFWSGEKGQMRAAADDEHLSASDVPLFKFLFDCWDYMKSHADLQPGGPAVELVGILPALFSAIFATYAQGAVKVYMSSSNDGVNTVININSAFWYSELYALMNSGAVSHIYLFLHQGKDVQGQDLWSEPLDLKDPKEQRHCDGRILFSIRGEKALKVPMGVMRKSLSLWHTKTTSC